MNEQTLSALWNHYKDAVQDYRANPTEENAKLAWAHYYAFMDAFENREVRQ